MFLGQIKVLLCGGFVTSHENRGFRGQVKNSLTTRRACPFILKPNEKKTPTIPSTKVSEAPCPVGGLNVYVCKILKSRLHILVQGCLKLQNKMLKDGSQNYYFNYKLRNLHYCNLVLNINLFRKNVSFQSLSHPQKTTHFRGKLTYFTVFG